MNRRTIRSLEKRAYDASDTYYTHVGDRYLKICRGHVAELSATDWYRQASTADPRRVADVSITYV